MKNKHRSLPARSAFIVANTLAATLFLGLLALPSQQAVMGYPNSLTQGPVTELLVNQSQWIQGGAFPGRVMALYLSGSDESLTPEHAQPTWLNSEGITSDLHSLKTHQVTTFAPYAQLTSFGLYTAAHDLFGNPNDVTPRNSIIHRRFDNTAARLFGVKYVLADSQLTDPRVRQISTIEGKPPVRVYEVDDPNISGFSPTRVVMASNWTQIRKSFSQRSFDPRVTALLLQDGPSADSVPAVLGAVATSSIRLVGSGIEIDAELANPQEPALLVLPFEFSHCMTVSSVSGQSPEELVPVNGILTGLVVSESGRYEIQALTSPFRTPVCRFQDIEWWKRLFAQPS